MARRAISVWSRAIDHQSIDADEEEHLMSQSGSTIEIWILGATGRIGRAVAARLAGTDVSLVLVGRDPDRLAAAAVSIDDRIGTLVARSPEEAEAEITRHHPAAVINTIGPFARTAVPIARPCLPGGHYLDLANGIVAVPALLGLHEEAIAAGSTLITGAGFGVLATEALVAELCQGQPSPTTVRVDALPSVELKAGTLGQALAASIVEGLPAGGRRYEGGHLVRAKLGGDPQRITLPDGQVLGVGNVPTGELHAAWIASGAPSVTATSSEAPTGRPVRAILPLAGAPMSIPSLRRFATRRLAAVRIKPRPRPRQHSWGHAVISWPDGTTREGWLRAGDAMDYTAAVAAEIAARLAHSDAPPGAYTPAAAFGPLIAASVGAELILD
jgi:short subunit dehydrogenase-like uncharacterized protein